MSLVKKMSRLLLSIILLLSINLTLYVHDAVGAETVIPISNAFELEQIRSNPSGDYKLISDIELTGEFVPINTFSGTLDGNGHTISNLTITANTNQPKVAFIIENKGIIEKLGFVNVNITGLSTDSTYRAGGIVESNRGVISESFVTGSIIGGYRSAGIAVTNYGQVKNVYSTAIVKAEYESGAIVAVSEGGSVLESSYAVPNVYSTYNNTGGISAYAYTSAVIRNNALLSGTIANGGGTNIARITGRVNGTPVFQNNIASVNALVQGAVVTGGTSSNNQGLSVTANALALRSTYEGIGWNFNSVWKMSSALNRPILRHVPEVKEIEIATAVDLELIRSHPSGDYKLISDIELTGEFVPINTFSGTLDGNGHTISNLTITANTNQPKVAFIIENKGIIEKLGFVDVNITGLSTDSTYRAGGIVESNRGVISESFVTGSIIGGYRSAGIAVTNYGQVKNVYSTAIVKAEYESGAIVAVSEGGSVLESSYVVPNVYSTYNNTGGISAYAYTSAVIRNNALLSGTIANGGGTNIARITGRVNGSPVFQNNIASSNALVQGAVVTGGTSSNNQGLSVTANALTLRSTYEGLGWNFNSVWKMSSVLNRPILRHVPEAKEIEIGTAVDLELIRSNPSGDYKLISDIELTGEFVPINTFSGTLDGNGHTISNLTITANANQPKVAFIIENKGIIERLGFIDVSIAGSGLDTNYWAGGIVASNKGLIHGCYVTGVVTGGYRSAGIAVHNHGIIRDSFTNAILRAKAESGAIVAVSESGSVLESSYAVPDVYSSTNNTGGISAYAYTSAVIRNNALLSGTIANGGGTNIARITGRVNGSPVFQNNIASSNALVQGAVVTGGTYSNNQGLSVTANALTLRSTYEGLGWDFDTVWEIRPQASHPVHQYFKNVRETQQHAIIYKILRDDTVVLANGVSHRQMDFIDSKGNIQKANIIDVDLNVSQNSIIVGTLDNQIPPTDANGNYIRNLDNEGHDIIKANVAVQAETTIIPGKKVIAGVNGEFYTMDGPEGYMIKDGSSIINGVRVPGADSKNYPFHGFFGIKIDGTAMIGDYGNDWEQEKNNLYQASGGQFWMVKDGAVQDFHGQVISNTNHPDYDGETYYRHKDRHPRTAVGIRTDGTVFFVVIDGRGSNDSTGLYIEELGLYMKELGAYQSLNMDGGGSSTAITLNQQLDEYEIKNMPINKINGVNTPGAPRDVFSSLLILVDQF